ncbi:MAG: DUF5317 domain-containing protein [Candidatus Bipolaricaulaceae bacterium]
MILLWGAVIGVVAGWLAGGRLRNLGGLRLRGGWLVGLALLIQLLIFPLGDLGPLVVHGTVPLHLASYGVLAAFLVWNVAHWPIAVMGLGLIANLVVIAANGGYMPADPAALARAGVEAAVALQQDGVVANVVLMGPETHLNFLGDWLFLPQAVPLATAFSLGDLAIGLGLALFFPYAMRGKRVADGAADDGGRAA